MKKLVYTLFFVLISVVANGQPLMMASDMVSNNS